MTKDHHRKDGKCLEGKEHIDFVTRTDAKGGSRLSGGDFFSTRPCFFVKCFLTVALERKSGITGVPFVLTEVSVPFVLSFFRALPHRHGPVGPSLHGMPEMFDFHFFLFSNTNENS